MGKRDHDCFTFSRVKGLYARNDAMVPPPGYLASAVNLAYSATESPILGVSNEAIFRSRETFAASTVFPAVPVRYYVYEKSTGNRFIMLDAAGQIWDVTSGLVIATIATATDFHGITLNDHFYFTPHDGDLGITGESVYIYDPTLGAAARVAGGPIIAAGFTVAVSATNGNIEPGLHVIAVSYETDTGHRTKPARHQTFTAPAVRKMVDLTAIPLGPAYATKRLIWMSRVVREYDGNIEAVPLYLVHTIADNVTVALANTVNAFDSQLISSADLYTDLLDSIPAGTFLTNVDGRLVVCGAFADPYVLRGSNQNQPEAVDAVDGLNEVMRGDGGGIKTTRALNGNVVWWKLFRTGALLNNGDVFSEWPKQIIDTALGSTVYGVSETMNQPNPSSGMHLVANQAGLFIFNGSYIEVLKPLSYVIESYWRALCTLPEIKRIKVVMDPIGKRVYCILPSTAAAGATELFMGDFSEGINWETIKWSLWRFVYTGPLTRYVKDIHIFPSPSTSNTNVHLIFSGLATSRIAATNGNLFQDQDADGSFDFSAMFGITDPELRTLHVNSLKANIGGLNNSVGAFDMIVTSRTGAGVTEALTVNQLAESVVEKFFNVSDFELLAGIVRIAGDTVGDIRVSQFDVFVTIPYAETSQL